MDQAQTTDKSTLSAKLDATRSGLVNAIAGKDSVAAGRVAIMFSKDSLSAEKVTLTPALSAAATLVDQELNGAKRLLKRLGINDISKEPGIAIKRNSLVVRPGHLKSGRSVPLGFRYAALARRSFGGHRIQSRFDQHEFDHRPLSRAVDDYRPKFDLRLRGPNHL